MKKKKRVEELGLLRGNARHHRDALERGLRKLDRREIEVDLWGERPSQVLYGSPNRVALLRAEFRILALGLSLVLIVNHDGRLPTISPLRSGQWPTASLTGRQDVRSSASCSLGLTAGLAGLVEVPGGTLSFR